jgi:membrane protein required for colicin V production
MNTVDIAILALFFGSGLIGLIRGFTREILSIVNWVGAIGLTYVFFPTAREIARGYVSNPMIADGAAAIVLFIILLIIFSIITGFFSDLVRASSLGGVDRTLGAAFGLIRGAFLVGVGEIILSTFMPRPTQQPPFQTAKFMPLARQAGDFLMQLLPQQARNFIANQSVKSQGVPSSGSATIMEQAIQKSIDTVTQAPSSATQQNAQHSSIPLPAPQSILPPLPEQPQQPRTPAPSSQQPLNAQQAVDALAQLKPQSSPQKQGDSDYTPNQRGDMDRLFQAAQDE